MRRMTRRWQERVKEHERDGGAVAVIYALSFLLLIGFIGLSIDLGAAFAKRQEAQNGADAAAIAVAAQCLEAKVATDCPGDYDAARQISLLNERTDASADVRDGDIQYSTPAPYHVTVTVTAEQRAWFLPAVGATNELTVRRAAIVNYGSPIRGNATLPVLIGECLFPGAADGEAPEYGSTVEFWLPQNAKKAEDADCASGTYPSGGFGWIADDDNDCSASVDMTVPVPSDPGVGFPTPECSTTFFAELARSQATVLVPLFDLSSYSGSNGEYTITRFAVLEITGFESQTGTVPAGTPGCASSQPAWASGTCFAGRFLEFTEDPGDFELGGPITELTFTRLVG